MGITTAMVMSLEAAFYHVSAVTLLFQLTQKPLRNKKANQKEIFSKACSSDLCPMTLSHISIQQGNDIAPTLN